MDTTTITRRPRRRLALGLGLAAASAAGALAAAPASAEYTVPDHHDVVCDSATFYRNYDSAQSAPVDAVRTLYRGNDIGHTSGAHAVYNGWANVFDFGPNDWGYIRVECIGA